MPFTQTMDPNQSRSTTADPDERQIPIIFNIDAEPDGFFINHRQKTPWKRL